MATGGGWQESKGSKESISKPGPSGEQDEDKQNITRLMESSPPILKHTHHTSEGNENPEDISKKDSKSLRKHPSKRKYQSHPSILKHSRYSSEGNENPEDYREKVLKILKKHPPKKKYRPRPRVLKHTHYSSEGYERREEYWEKVWKILKRYPVEQECPCPRILKPARYSSEGNENPEYYREKVLEIIREQPSPKKVTFKLNEEPNRDAGEAAGDNQPNRDAGEADGDNQPNRDAGEADGNNQPNRDAGEADGNNQSNRDAGEADGNNQSNRDAGEAAGDNQPNRDEGETDRNQQANQQRRQRNSNPQPPRRLRGRWAPEEEEPLVVVEPISGGMLRNVAQQTEKMGSYYKNQTCRENFKNCYFKNVHEIGHSWVIFLFQFLVGCLAASAIVMGIMFIRSCVGAYPASVPVFTILMGLSGSALLYKWVTKVCRERRGDRYWNSEKKKLTTCFLALLFCMVLESIFFRHVSTSNLQGSDDVKCDKIYVTYMYCLHVVNVVFLALAALLYFPDCVSYISNFKFLHTSNANGGYQPL